MDSMNHKQKPVAGSKLEGLQGMYTPEIQQSLGDVNRAVGNYEEKGDDDAYMDLLVAVLKAALGNALMFAPVKGLSADRKGMELGDFDTNAGKGYVLCTSPEEAALCPEAMIVLVKSGAVIHHAMNDQGYNGVVINPYGKRPVMLQREHLAMALQVMGYKPS